MHHLIRMPFQLIGDLQAAERRAWERKILGTIPRPAVVQYAPISVLPARMCTVSHCHTMLQGQYPYRRCERHRLQNRHHSKLKRVRDKEVKSTPLRGESIQDPESVESGRSKTRAVESSYPNEDRDLDAFGLETEGPGMSEVCLHISIHPYLQWYPRAGRHRRELYPTCCSWQPSFKYCLLRQIVPECTLSSLAVEDVRQPSGERSSK